VVAKGPQQLMTAASWGNAQGRYCLGLSGRGFRGGISGNASISGRQIGVKTTLSEPQRGSGGGEYYDVRIKR